MPKMVLDPKLTRHISQALMELYPGREPAFINREEGPFIRLNDDKPFPAPPEFFTKLEEIGKRPPPTRIDPLQEELVNVLADEGIIPPGRVEAIKRKLNRVR